MMLSDGLGRWALPLLFALSCEGHKAAPSADRAKDAADGAVATAHVTAAGRPAGFLKGQLHMHTNRSGDSDTPPEIATRWYADHGFDFVVTTDHNVVTRVPNISGMLVIPGVELTQNLRTCDPPPPAEMACLLHVNALFVGLALDHVWWPSPAPTSRLDLYQRAVDQARAAGGMAMLNHPNFQDAADADLAVSLAAKGLTLIEIENRAVDSNNEGDASRPSTEALWDAALTRGAHLFGTATDDAHHYDDADSVRARGETAYVGDRGFVMVRSEKTPEAIRGAIERGDFYGSTGLYFDALELSQNNTKKIHVEARDAVLLEAIGTAGKVLATSNNHTLDVDLEKVPRGYVRVRAHDSAGHVAFTQPVFLP